MNKELLRKLPKIDELLKEDIVNSLIIKNSRTIVLESLRESIDFYRNGILKGSVESLTTDQVLDFAIHTLNSKNKMHLERVINATGTVIHTNLGRSLLGKKVMESVLTVAGNYNNLEYDIESGKRGSRYSHIEDIIKRITGAEAAMVVNNNAAAIMLVLDTLAKGKEAVVSRGELVEIGGSFRIPEVMKFSGAKLVEIGTTNRTHLYDYEDNITEDTGVLLKVHTSNFKVFGFTEAVSIEELVALGNERDVPVVEDIGSGVLIDFTKYGFTYEPTVQESIKKGIDVITFSGDKMLGGPQAGIIAGKKKYIDMMKKNQITRALRVDKMTLAALEGTLKYYIDEKDAIENIPSLNMILMPKEEVKKKCILLKRKLQNKTVGFEFAIDLGESMVGGGSMPTEKIPTYVIKVSSDKFSPQDMEEKLRLGETPLITRVYNNELVLDGRTLFKDDFDEIVKCFIDLK
ncbi:MAG: L-seryl-tRNA(Sec) selenium transferase [Clostridium sp.]|uniref:L-seryl-tRNA(Sec) selenium transferase n=1 Tax=Clostridium sp. TaxID=1506 RepID=UPI00301F23DB